MKGILIAGTKSGSGKTTVTLGLLAALRKRGITTAPFKVGPDFIDPGHHRAITGRNSYNLDGWMLSQDFNQASFAKNTQDADIAIVEGVMGLFDGYDGKSEAGSAAQMAKWLNLPVILVVDAKSMARSAAALVQGFERFDPDLRFAGVIFNNIGSPRHLKYLKDAMTGNVTMPCLGGLIRDKNIQMPERHLGLVTSEDHSMTVDFTDGLADLIENSIDLDRLIDRLPEIEGLNWAYGNPNSKGRVKIGVARDRAFCFYYPDNLEILQAYGAELIEFSPIDDRNLPRDLDGLYLGGGYPELAAEDLFNNRSMQEQILEKSRQGMPIYSECGGFMYLCREISDTQGNAFPMTGCFPFRTQMSKKLRSLGYREITLSKSSILGNTKRKIRGHEFHYSEIIERDPDSEPETVFQVSARAGLKQTATGYMIGRTLGSYIHLHFGSCPQAAGSFVESCLAYQRETANKHE
ncbi:cobyrinate a,c-diamide synthase [Desulfococcaceae bacterium HSG7]|nr:cobyrinate a,c-diamide synthase [Desulfococcaceae bacterium HSG7]